MLRIRTSILGVAALAIVSLGGCRTATPLTDGALLADAPLPSAETTLYGSGSDDYGIPPQPALPMPEVSEPAAVTSAPAPMSSGSRAVVRTAARVEYPAPPPSGWASPFPEEGEIEVIEEAPAGAPMVDGEFAAPAPGGEGEFIEIIEEEPAYEMPAAESFPAPVRAAPIARRSRPIHRTYCSRDYCKCFDKYLGIHAELYPGIGGGFTFGWRFHQSRTYSIAWEVAAGYQDLWEEFMGEGLTGKYMYINTGAKLEIGNPCDTFRPYVRAGVTLFELSQLRGAPGVPAGGGSEFQANVTDDLIDFDRPGSNIGGYVSVGADWRMGRTSQWTMGPEFGWFIGENLSRGGEANNSFYFRWNFSYEF